jgi:hypothetical protein
MIDQSIGRIHVLDRLLSVHAYVSLVTMQACVMKRMVEYGA